MAYCAVGSMSMADWEQIKKLCKTMRTEMDTKLSALEAKLEAEIASLDVNQLQVIRSQLEALASSVSTFLTGQEVQDARLDDLEASAANLEITTAEILEIWESRNG